MNKRCGQNQEDELDHQHSPESKVVRAVESDFKMLSVSRQTRTSSRAMRRCLLRKAGLPHLLPKTQHQDEGKESEFDDVHDQENWQFRYFEQNELCMPKLVEKLECHGKIANRENGKSFPSIGIQPGAAA